VIELLGVEVRSAARGALHPRGLLHPRLVLLLFVLAASSATAQIELQPRVFEIASKLRCPVCVSESVAQSAAPTSVRMREIIAEKLEAGESEAEILAYFQARYGDWILLEPPRRGIYLVVWIVPAVAVVLVLAVLAFYIRRWTRRGQESVEADAGYLDRVRRSLESTATPGGGSK
jgi:cytochrome c-type biogenesis protein CcmH